VSGTYISVVLRRLVHQRAEGCCEYCGMPEAFSFAPHQIDHIVSEKHGGPTESENLALCCTICNLHKGSDVAGFDSESGLVTALFHPRRQRWVEHFRLLPNGALSGLSPEGRTTIRLLRLNSPERMEERLLLLGAGLWAVHARQ
jgi:hypothetical protein